MAGNQRIFTFRFIYHAVLMSEDPRAPAPSRFGDNPVKWLASRYRVRLLRRAFHRSLEILRYACVRPQHTHHFHVVSTQRNAGQSVLDCLDSVEQQRYPKEAFQHLVIDDNSDDHTVDVIREWCSSHPGHRVDFIAKSERRGGTRNTLDGIRQVGHDSIVIELNGDDRLPDPGVFSFLNKVYQDPGVWLTYNTQRESTGVIPFQLPPPRVVRRSASYRDHPWATSHLHSFRRPLFDHVPEEIMIDPDTGEYWASADDVALYLWMLELAGSHARHVWRITYLYNFHGQTEYQLDREGQLARERRIRQGTRAEPLDQL
jgi:glycosyltransferase involved in cell wall biosynthesis